MTVDKSAVAMVALLEPSLAGEKAAMSVGGSDGM